MIAVFVNCIAIIIGSLIGVIFSSRISDNLSRVVQTGAGVVTMVIGIEMALAYENIIFFRSTSFPRASPKRRIFPSMSIQEPRIPPAITAMAKKMMFS